MNFLKERKGKDLFCGIEIINKKMELLNVNQKDIVLIAKLLRHYANSAYKFYGGVNTEDLLTEWTDEEKQELRTYQDDLTEPNHPDMCVSHLCEALAWKLEQENCN